MDSEEAYDNCEKVKPLKTCSEVLLQLERIKNFKINKIPDLILLIIAFQIKLENKFAKQILGELKPKTLQDLLKIG